jgi:hypothetical protein
MARNLEALGLEVPQSNVLITREDRMQSKVTLDSLNLNTGYQGILDTRERKVEELARKYKVELSEFEKAEMIAKIDDEEEFYPAIESQKVLEQSIRESVAHWKDISKQQYQNGEAVDMALREPPVQMKRREFSGQKLLNDELSDVAQPEVYSGPGYSVIHKGARPQVVTMI